MELYGDPDALYQAVMALLVNEIQLRDVLESTKYCRLMLNYLVACCTHLFSTNHEVKEHLWL